MSVVQISFVVLLSMGAGAFISWAMMVNKLDDLRMLLRAERFEHKTLEAQIVEMCQLKGGKAPKTASYYTTAAANAYGHDPFGPVDEFTIKGPF